MDEDRTNENHGAGSGGRWHGGPQPPQAGDFPFPFLGFNPLRNDAFLKGLAVGAGVGLMLANPMVQRTLMRAAAKAWAAVQGEFEEAKERFRDAEAEVRPPRPASDEAKS